MRSKNASKLDRKHFFLNKFGNVINYLPKEFYNDAKNYRNSGLLTIAFVTKIWKPKNKKPSPYVVIVPGSGGMSRAAAQTYGRYADILVEKGFGVVLYDIFYNTGVDRGTVSRGASPNMGSLSVIEFIKNKKWRSPAQA